MAIVVRTNPVAGASASFPDDYNNQNTKYLAGQRGYVRADLDDYADGSTAPEVVIGSEFEVDGDIVVVQTANEAISGIAAIANSNTVYVYYDVSAAVFLASTTAPTWSTALGGWYNSDDRCLFGVYKDSSGDYNSRFMVGRDSIEKQEMTITLDSLTADVAIPGTTWTTWSTYYNMSYNSIIGASLTGTGFTLPVGEYEITYNKLCTTAGWSRLYNNTESAALFTTGSTPYMQNSAPFTVSVVSEIDIQAYHGGTGTYFRKTDYSSTLAGDYISDSIKIKRIG